jgi:hypothetical protein
VFLRKRENGFGISHENSLPGFAVEKIRERSRTVLAGSRLLQSVALRRPKSLKPVRRGWQFDCSYSGDNGSLYLSCPLSAISLQPGRLGLLKAGTECLWLIVEG